MNVLFIAQNSNRRARMLFHACELIISRKKNSKIILIVLDNSFEKNSRLVKTKKYLSDYKLCFDIQNESLDMCIYSSWIGDHRGIIDLIKNLGLPLFSDFIDCAFGLDFLQDSMRFQKEQTYCIEASDGIILRDERWIKNNNAQNYLKNKDFIIFNDFLLFKAKQLNFLNPTNNLKKLVFVGSLGKKELESEIGYLKIIDNLTKKNFQITFLPCENHIDHNIKSPYFRRHLFNNKFLLLESTRFQDVPSILVTSSWGLNINQKCVFPALSNRVKADYLKYCSSNRNYDYTESGLGVIMSSDLEFMNQRFAPSGCSVCVNDSNFTNLEDILLQKINLFSETEYREWEKKNLLKYNVSEINKFILSSRSTSRRRKIQKKIPLKSFCDFLAAKIIDINTTIEYLQLQKNKRKKVKILDKWCVSISKRINKKLLNEKRHSFLRR